MRAHTSLVITLHPHPEIDVCIEDELSIFEIARMFEVPVGLITYSKKQTQ